MPTATTNLELRKPNGADTVDEALDLNDNWDKVDATWAAATPSTQAIGDAAAGGSQLRVSRSDHLHGMPSFATPGSLAIGQAPAAGVSPNLPRADHGHGLPAFGTPVDVGSANAAGVATTIARADHVHNGLGSLAANTASAATVALPAGKFIPITGVVTIASLTGGVAGREVVLIFAARNCTVRLAAPNVMQGPYISDIGGTLSLYHDGTIWHETGRSGFIVPGARYRLSADFSVIAGIPDKTVVWDENSWNYGLSAIPVSEIVPGIVGRWHIHGLVPWNDNPVGNVRSGHLFQNGVTFRRLFDWVAGTGATNDSSAPGAFSEEVEVASVTDSYSLRLFTTQTAFALGGPTESHIIFSFLGR